MNFKHYRLPQCNYTWYCSKTTLLFLAFYWECKFELTEILVVACIILSTSVFYAWRLQPSRIDCETGQIYIILVNPLKCYMLDTKWDRAMLSLSGTALNTCTYIRRHRHTRLPNMLSTMMYTNTYSSKLISYMCLNYNVTWQF